MKIKKSYLIMYIVVLVSVIIMFIATSCSYYAKIKETKTDVNVNVKNFDLLLMFENGNQINGYNLKPGWSNSIEFSIQNFSTETIGKYKIVLESITPLSNMVDEDFVYEVVGESDSKDTINKLLSRSSTPVPVVTKDIGSGVITPNTTHKYKISFKIKNNAESKKYSDKNVFSTKIKIVNDDN